MNNANAGNSSQVMRDAGSETDARAYLRAVLRRWRVVVAFVILGILTSGLFAFLQTPKYVTSVTFFVSTSSSSGMKAYEAGQYAQQRVQTYVGLASSERLAAQVAAEVGNGLTPTQLEKKISASADLNTVLLTVEVADSSASQSQAIGRALTTRFVSLVAALERGNGKSPTARLVPVSGPTLNPVPVSPRTKLDLAVGIVGGLAIGVLIALAMEFMDTSYKSAEDAQKSIGVPVLAEVPVDRGVVRRAGRRANRTARQLEALRQLRAALQYGEPTVSPGVLCVTSPSGTEGSSAISGGLAAAFEEAELRVLLVRADDTRRDAGGEPGERGQKGLLNVLRGDVDLQDAVQATQSVAVLSRGAVPGSSTTLLERELGSLVTRLRALYDVVIFDAPAVLPGTEGRVISRSADGTVLVIRHGKTPRERVLGAARVLRSLDARVVGVVLNKASVRGSLAVEVEGRHHQVPAGGRPSEPVLPESVAERNDRPSVLAGQVRTTSPHDEHQMGDGGKSQ